MLRRDVVLVLLVGMVWGFNFVAAKWAVAELPPFLTNMLRFTMVVIVFSPFLKIVPGRMKEVLIAAFAFGVLHFGAVFTSMSLAGGVGSVAIASQLNVPISTLLAIVFLKESVGWRRAAGIALSFLGVMVLGFDPDIFQYWDALLVMVLAAFFYSIAAILMRRLKHVPAVTMQAWVGVAGVSGSLVISLVVEQGQVAALKAASTQAWLAVLYSGVGSSIVGHSLANHLLRKYEVSVVSPYFLATPLFAVLCGVLVLDEAVSWRMAFGGVLTILGVMVVTIRNIKKAKRIVDVAGPVESHATPNV